jgi:hypothetical protein
MLVLISFDGWKVGMVLKSMTDDITDHYVSFNMRMSNSNDNDMI